MKKNNKSVTLNSIVDVEVEQRIIRENLIALINAHTYLSMCDMSDTTFLTSKINSCIKCLMDKSK